MTTTGGNDWLDSLTDEQRLTLMVAMSRHGAMSGSDLVKALRRGLPNSPRLLHVEMLEIAKDKTIDRERRKLAREAANLLQLLAARERPALTHDEIRAECERLCKQLKREAEQNI